MSLLVDIEKDREWFDTDRESYDNENLRSEFEYDKQFKEHMGEEYSKPYKLYLEELENNINIRIDNLNKLVELKAPSAIFEEYQKSLEEYMTMFNEKQYIVSDEDKQYRINYEERESSFKFSFKLNIPEFLNYDGPTLIKGN